MKGSGNGMKENKKVFEFDKYEIGILINSLMNTRNQLIAKNEDTKPINEKVLKIIETKSKKKWLNNTLDRSCM